MVSHLDLFWRRGKPELGNVLFTYSNRNARKCLVNDKRLEFYMLANPGLITVFANKWFKSGKTWLEKSRNTLGLLLISSLKLPALLFARYLWLTLMETASQLIVFFLPFTRGTCEFTPSRGIAGFVWGSSCTGASLLDKIKVIFPICVPWKIRRFEVLSLYNADIFRWKN